MAVSEVAVSATPEIGRPFAPGSSTSAARATEVASGCGRLCREAFRGSDNGELPKRQRCGRGHHYCESLLPCLLLRPEFSSSRLSSFKKSVLVARAFCFVGANLCRALLTAVRKRCASS
jgi:hypothetical protein